MLEVRPFSKPKTFLQWFKDREKLDLSPSYQRRSDLWPNSHKQLLINSVLNHYDIPKIYVADFTYMDSALNEGKKPYAMIDGKQRLTTVFSFFTDDLSLGATPVLFEGKEVTVDGCRYSDLKKKHPMLAQRFENFTPTVMSVISDRLEEIQELFIRLNLNVSISGPERRNAMPGPLPPLIRDLSVHEFFRRNATFPISRGQDLNVSAKFLLMEHVGGFTNTKKADLDKFVMSAKERDRGHYLQEFRAAGKYLEAMTDVFVHEDDLLSGQAQIPIYYWLVRECPSNKRPRLRDFLASFERDRFEAKRASEARAQGANVPSPDTVLIQYNAIIRSPDDKRQQEFMYNTLRKRFGAF